MPLALVSLLAGMLTILSPCVLPLLPIIVGGSVSGGKNKYTPYIITASLAVSVLVFTLLLKVSTLFLDISPQFWTYISGGLITVFGIAFLFPNLWEGLSAKINFNSNANKLLGKSSQQSGVIGPVLMGIALGPVFSSCSPTYAIIIATVLPASFATGLGYLIFYVIGLAGMLLLIALAGQKAVNKLQWASDPNGVFRKVLGAIFIVIGIGIITGFDKTIEAWLVSHGLYINISEFEFNLINNP